MRQRVVYWRALSLPGIWLTFYSQHHFLPPLHYSEKSPTDLENNPLKIRQRIQAASFSPGPSTVNTLDSTNCFPQEGHTEGPWGGRGGRAKRRIHAICPREELCLCVTRSKCVVGGGVCRASVSRPVLCKVKAPAILHSASRRPSDRVL